jgi:hyaluronan synthase
LPFRPVWWLSVAELLMWCTFTGVLAFTLLVRPLVMGQLMSVYYLGFVLLMAYARSARHDTRGLWVMLLAPIYALMHVVVFTPVRLWAMLTLRDGSWGTRSAGIEVTASGRGTKILLPPARSARDQVAL